MNLEFRELSPDLWPQMQALFGKTGACGGCWCMSWRLKKGEKWESVKGEPARQRMKDLVASGRAHGILAFADGEPVGWCSFDRRTDYDRLNRAPSLKCPDAEQVWSIPCFFIKRGYRNRGISGGLLDAALSALQRLGATVAEGYPQRPKQGRLADPFVWTGILSVFERAGFTPFGPKETGKIMVRKTL